MTDKEQIASLKLQISQALARIAELEALLLAQSVVKNSKNSSVPPSVDLARKNESLREKSDKKVGGQPGHKGTNLKMSTQPDKIEPLYPAFCTVCGDSLAGAEFQLAARRQVVDIPPIVPVTTEYQSFGTVCSCGNHQCGTFPTGVDYAIQYGPNVQALAVYQSCYQYLPFGRLQDFFGKVCNLAISTGTIENFIRRAARKGQPAYEQLRKVVAISFFVGSDETGFKLNGGKGWFWVWQTAIVTFIVAACTRAKSVITDTFPEGLPHSILCSDRLAAQLSTITKGSQICLAHLLRDLNYLIAAEKTTWAMDFKALLQEAIALKQAQAFYPINAPKALEIEARATQLLADSVLAELLKEPEKHSQTITFFRGMIKLRHALFTFLYHKEVPFDNNGSERAIRMVKVKMKVSGQFKSLHQEFAVIRSIIGTAIKNEQSVFQAIRALVDIPLPKTTVAP